MTVTIVMTTYNGSKYILEQMDSLKNQTRQADEVLILDDCSTDNTVEIIKSYINDNNLSNWRIVENSENVGWKKNFFLGFKQASCDIIFPCDQDDIWHEDKIQMMSSIMNENNEINVLEGKPHKFFNDEIHVLKNNKSIKNTLRIFIGLFLDKINDNNHKSHNTKKVNKKKLDKSLFRVAPGCVFAVRKVFFEEIEKFWNDSLPHDALLSYFSKLTDSYYEFDCEVIEYRQHIGSASRTLNRNKASRLNEIEVDVERLNTINKFKEHIDIPPKYLKIINGFEKLTYLRIKLLKENSVLSAVILLKYIMYYTQIRRYFTDLKYGLFNK